MNKGTFVKYNGKLAVVVRTGLECSTEAGGELDDHLGLWFGNATGDEIPEVRTIPAAYVESCEVKHPVFEH